jgi:hypothetical protein
VRSERKVRRVKKKHNESFAMLTRKSGAIRLITHGFGEISMTHYDLGEGRLGDTPFQTDRSSSRPLCAPNNTLVWTLLTSRRTTT